MMNPFSRLLRPEWEHRDAARRAAAVSRLDHPELLEKLPEMARNDPDAEVRRLAIRRLDNLALLADRMRNDPDAGVRDAARQRYQQRLLDATVPRAERERLLRVEDDVEVLVSVAEQAPEAELRRLALERADRPGLNIERCIKDPDPELRAWLLERIEDVTVLERIAERVRKTDKLLNRRAHERARELLLAAGDPVATRERALGICEEVDELRRSVAPDAKARRQDLWQEWLSLAPRLDEAMALRVQGYFETLDAALAGPPAPSPAAVVQPEPLPEAPRETDPALIALQAELEARIGRLDLAALDDLEKRWAARVRSLVPLLPDEEARNAVARERLADRRRYLREQARQLQELLDGLPQRLEDLERALAEGQLAEAREQQRVLEADRDRLGARFPRGLGRRLGRARQEVERLDQWQRWSGNRARLRLIGEVEALGGSGLHPDAVAARLKDLQTEWKSLDDAEGRVDADAGHPLVARFHAASRRVLAPARGYFEKRAELRGVRREQVEAFLNEAGARLEEALPPRELLALRRQVVDRLRQVDALEPGARRELSQRLRELLGRIKAGVARSEAEAEVTKRRLLANLRRDLMHVELEAALPIARQAQANWKTLPRAARPVEDALWAELRELVDPWFGQADQRQRERLEARQAGNEAAREILAELEQLARADAQTLLHADARLTGLRARWLEVSAELARIEPSEAGDDRRRPTAPSRRKPGRGVDERAFDQALSRVQAARARLSRAAQRKEREQLLHAASLCDALDALAVDAPAAMRADLLAQLESLELSGPARAVVRQRIDPGSAAGPDPVAADRTEDLVVLAELAAGLESPATARERRRRLQIERLSAHLSGSTGEGGDVDALLLEYIGLAAAPVARRAELTARWRLVLEASTSPE